jgi:Anti-sigma-K factor rskA
MTELTPPSPSEPWSELLAGYVLGDLTPTEITMVEQYLADHPEQQAEIASLMLPLDLMSLSLPPDQPPAALRQRIMQMTETVAVVNNVVVQTAESQLTSQPQRSENSRWRLAIAGLGLSLLAGLGWQNYHLHQELAQVKQNLHQMATAQKQPNLPLAQTVVQLLQQPNNRFLSLKSMGKKPMGMGSLVMAPQKSSAVLTLQQVPPIADGKVYRVWAILGDGEMACGDFLPDAQGQVLMELPLNSWSKVNKVTITIEEKSAVHAVGEIAIEGESQI